MANISDTNCNTPNCKAGKLSVPPWWVTGPFVYEVNIMNLNKTAPHSLVGSVQTSKPTRATAEILGYELFYRESSRKPLPAHLKYLICLRDDDVMAPNFENMPQVEIS